MNFNFELILFYATLLSGAIALLDILFLQKKRQAKKIPIWIDYARSFFPVLLIVFLLRSFLFEPFRIPSGSLEPTLQIGDFIIVNKFDYGTRLPIVHQKVLGSGKPARGDIVVFRFPPNPSVNYIKRVVGLPHDRISYVDKELTVNGIKVPQTFLGDTQATGEDGSTWEAQEKRENLLGVKHHILLDKTKASMDLKDVVV